MAVITPNHNPYSTYYERVESSKLSIITKEEELKFGNTIVEACEKLKGTLTWFDQNAFSFGGEFIEGEYVLHSRFFGGRDPAEFPETYSDYEKMFLGTLHGEIQTVVCWQLFGYLLLKLGILPHPQSHVLLEKKITEWAKLWPNMGEDKRLEPGDLVFMNGSSHVVISTGRGDEVLSLWSRPKHGICLTTIKELIRRWPAPYKDNPALKPTLLHIPVGAVYAFVQSIKE